MTWLLTIAATLAFAPAAYAQGGTVQAAAPDVTWTPPTVTIAAGESVTWTWDGFHNVRSKGTNWTAVGDTSPFSQRFDTPGTYTFVCQFHESQGMTGTVTVNDTGGSPPPPLPPPPPSEQPWTNDQQPPTAFELSDEVRPRLTRIRVTAVRNGARVRFRLSERARVTVRFRLGGVAVKTARKTFGAGPSRLTVRSPRMHGRYRLDMVARDLSGNRSLVRHARVTVR